MENRLQNEANARSFNFLEKSFPVATLAPADFNAVYALMCAVELRFIIIVLNPPMYQMASYV